MREDLVARRLFKAQIREELLAELKKYQVGFVANGIMMAIKDVDISNGVLFIIPEEQYRELFGEPERKK